MPRRSLLVSMSALVLALAGCTQDEGPVAEQETRSPSSAAPADAPATTEAPEADDLLAADATDRVPGRVDEIARSGDGSTLVLLGDMYRNVTHYRVYDEQWRPTSPPLRVEAVPLRGSRGAPWFRRPRDRDQAERALLTARVGERRQRRPAEHR